MGSARAIFAFALVALALPVCASGTPARDGATIVDSGSTNTSGYKIDVWSDGNAGLTLQGRMGAAQGSTKSFAISANLAKRFFADLEAARLGNAAGTPCMKSASFGTTTHVQWHGWISPDLDCPAENTLTAALVSDVNAIRSASGVGTIPLHRPILAPPHVEASP